MNLLKPGSRLRQMGLRCGALAGVVVPRPPASAARAFIAHPAYCTTDTAGGTPCGDGDSVRFWRDAVTGTWYEQATSGSRPILRRDGSKWYAEGDGTRHVVTAASFTAAPGGWLCAAVRPTALVGDQRFLAGPSYRLSAYGTAYRVNNGANNEVAAQFVNGTDARMAARMSDTAGALLYRNGSLILTAAASTGVNFGTVTLLALSGGFIGFVGRLYGAAWAGGASIPIAELDAWMSSLLP